jgi:predicted nucleic-acid-binding Zn-ribbon protein
MTPFNKDTKCPKCGCDNLHHRYRAAGQRIDEDFLAFDTTYQEIIRTHCRTCGYKWSSSVASEQSEKAEAVR